ncbi:MAG: CehA/McbA family metallohydrolase [Gemmatimonadota bacterium]
MHIPVPRVLFALVLSVPLLPLPLSAQWTNRYPKVRGYGHHVYLEGYELPTLTTGPIDAAPAPDGAGLAVASEGWLWQVDAEGRARRLTEGAGIDARPAWSPDGRRLAFVRDDTRALRIVERDLEDGSERVLVDDGAIVLDPAYAPDGRTLYFSSARAGDLDLWRLDLASGTTERITEGQGLERAPRPHPDGRRLVYLSKSRAGGDEIRVRDLQDGTDTSLLRGSIASQASPALSPDGRLVAVNWPTEDGWELRLLATDAPGPTVRLTRARGLPLTPSFSADGAHVYFSEASDDEAMQLFRVGAGGGPVERVEIRARDWGVPTGTLRVLTSVRGEEGLAAARLSVTDGNGHPLVPPTGQPRFDGQTGQVFVYSPGVLEWTVPAGVVRMNAVHGLLTPDYPTETDVEPGGLTEVQLGLVPVADLRAEGWWSGEHHFHLNYGGTYRLDPSDLIPMARAEDLDVVTPLLANLHNRFEDQALWETRAGGAPPYAVFGQEVRSHFLGHLGLVGTRTLFWPWVWGPGYEVYGTDDRPNAEALAHSRAEGGLAVYVHPVSGPEPFASAESAGALPVEMIADAVLGDLDGLEVACLWSNEEGTTDLWHRFLDVGLPIVPTAGTDVMNNFYRTMAVGTTRAYVRPVDRTGAPVQGRAPDLQEYLRGLAEGRSFVTTGPMVLLRVGDAQPGDVVPSGRTPWTLDVASAVPAERVELLVNGEVVWSERAPDGVGRRRYEGTLTLPAGGWVAARVTGPAVTAWPAMNTHAFAHTAPVWIERVGSTDPEARRRSAAVLLTALDAATASLRRGYGSTPTPRLDAHFQAARARLVEWSR